MSAQMTAGRQGCCFGTEADHCGAPAVVHVLFDDADATMSCDEHEAWWRAHSYADRHPIMHTCGLPGTTWLYSWVDPDGRCLVEGLGSAELVERAEASA